MNRLLIIWLFVVATSAFAGSNDVSIPIDLDRPGAIEALKVENPVHFNKIQQILQGAGQLPLPSIRGWIRVQFDATDVSSPLLIKTSFPPKALLSFVLDKVRYNVTVTLSSVKGKVVPEQ